RAATPCTWSVPGRRRIACSWARKSWTRSPIDFIGIKEYVSFMVTYSELRGDRRRFLALTGLTLPEFESLLAAFARSYERRYPADRTAAGRPRKRRAGGGRTAVLREPAQKLLFL